MASLKDILDKVFPGIFPKPVQHPQAEVSDSGETEQGVESSNSGEEKVADAEWEDRRLCSDESCIGVIGPDGRCKECGKPYEGGLEIKEPLEKPEAQAAPEPEVVVEAGEAVEPAVSSEEDPEWENRKLCSDESCIGVIGPDGRCKECGKPYEGD